ncbi:MAG: cupin domain-containing protein [Acidobacteria bacterium]|nr:cupin domain-containing protein [Acidobacteriota bacterium]
MNAQKTAAKAKGFASNIEIETIGNTNFRRVMYSGRHLQLVLMSLGIGEEIGEEVHLDTDQFFRFESGTARCIVNDTEHELGPGDVLVVPAGAKHNVINADPGRELKLYTVYAPPHHKDGIVRAKKADAIKYEAEFDGVTTE